MNFLPLIEAKRDGHELSGVQVSEIISAYTAGKIPEYQMASFLMAVYFKGLTTAETTALTMAMRDSGDMLEFPEDDRPLVDKHSTGGVGDKVSLPLAPFLACLGFRVPMISGRGLGITGGTLDKLDSIPGFKTTLPASRITEIVQTVGCVICGQTDRMVPADKGLYALRDVTGTVPSMPLIVASIMSKKLAESLDALVLDVKFGTAAFMPTLEKARELAQAMATLGNQCGVKTRALLTNMNSPLGRAAGNWLEVKESVACLEGRGPDDLRELVLACAAQLLTITGKTSSLAAARTEAETCLNSGRPREMWDDMIAAQGADMAAFRQKLEQEPNAGAPLDVTAQTAGYISRADARVIGETIRDLGGGRLNKESAISYDVGVDKLARPGERVEKGSLLARVHAPDKARAEAARGRIQAAFAISPQLPPAMELIAGEVT